jgi:hypothetical protein
LIEGISEIPSIPLGLIERLMKNVDPVCIREKAKKKKKKEEGGISERYLHYLPTYDSIV